MDISIIELFSGIGAQYQALKNANFDIKSIATCEIDKDAMLSYSIMHNDLTKEKLETYQFPTKEEMINYLSKKNIGFDFKKNIPYNWTRLNIQKIKEYYLASILSKNLGDISKVDSLPQADLWTYSFPCQDISVAGKMQGIVKGQTRSGLLYEVERLLDTSNHKPKYLLLENVKNLVGKNFKPQFDLWIQKLDQLGYQTYYQVLNAKNFGMPQNRERVFALSIRKDLNQSYQFPQNQKLTSTVLDYLEENIPEKYYLKNKNVEKLLNELFKTNQLNENKSISDSTIYKPKIKNISNCITARYNSGIQKKQSIGTVVIEPKIDILMKIPEWRQRGFIYNTHGVLGCLAATDYKTPKLILDGYQVRKLTPKECLRLMGFPDEKIDKLIEYKISDMQLYKQAGNSIVVNVLTAIFKELLTIL